MRCTGGAPLQKIPIRVEERWIDQTIDQRKIATCELSIEEIEHAVVLNRSTNASTKLMTRLLRVDGGVAVARVELFIAEEPVSRSVNIITSASRNRIDHTARSTAEFRGVSARQDLKLLNGVLGYLRRNSSASRILVIELICGVVSVRQIRIAAGNASKTH